ncbi:MAG: hypothetical protein N3A66_11435, partial [Planctomycetota bacterium]|nr:hypothetical protein [Planctomycetota bacterium]
MKRLSGGAFILFWALAAGAGENGDDKPLPERDMFVKLVNQLAAGLTRDRVEAIEALGRQTNADLIREFQVVEKLTAVAEDRNKTASPLERAAAVRSLAVLYSKNLGRQDTIETLVKIVEDSKTDVRVRLDVLRLLAEMGQRQDRITTLAFNALKKMWDNRPRLTPPLPPLVQKDLIECLGGFYKQEGVKSLLWEAFFKEKSQAVRLGA